MEDEILRLISEAQEKLGELEVALRQLGKIGPATDLQRAVRLAVREELKEIKVDTTPSLMNEKDAARYIGMSRAYLAQGRCDGNLSGRTPTPPFVRIGRTIRYLAKDLDAWLEEHRVMA